MPVISVIVPVYHVEKYICTCLDSLIRQTLRDIEIIAVDDGSPDDCGKICDRYALQDRRIIVIHQENGGVSSARNAGLERAKGDWITFLDPDDWLEEDALEVALAAALKYEGDIVGWNNYYEYENKQEKRAPITPDPLLREGPEIKGFLLAALSPEYDERTNRVSTGEILGVWSKLFKREIILGNGLRFTPGLKLGEDALFCFQAFNHAGKIILIDRYLHHYRIWPMSANRGYRPGSGEAYLSLLEAFFRVLKERMNDRDYRLAFTGLLGDCLYGALQKDFANPHNPQPFSTKIKDLRDFLAQDILREGFKHSDTSGYGLSLQILMALARKRMAIPLYFIQKLRNQKYGELA